MNLSRIPYVALVAGLALSGYASPLIAGEKLQLSGSSDKANKAADLSGPRTKPLLPTLDFKQLTGHGATVSAEQLAPMNPPQGGIIDPALLEKKKKGKDRDWLKEKDGEQDDSDQESNSSSSTNRKKDKLDQDKQKGRKANEKDENDPFKRDKDKDRYNFEADGSASSSTNRISFSSKDRKSDNPFEMRSNSTGLIDNSPAANIGRPRGAQANPFEGNERAETLRLMGVTPPASSQSTFSQPTALSIIKGGAATASGASMDATLRTAGQNQSVNLPLNGRDSGPRSPFGDAGLGNSELGGVKSAVPAYEPFRTERKPLVLPVPQRKF